MKRIKLKSLLNLTEQAPQPPLVAPQSAPKSTPAPDDSAPAEPDASPDAQISSDTSPTPEDPGEYDFTKDFRAFEDTKNKAEAAAKKKLMDKMNKLLLGKKIVANASRGYGQPRTDYTIEKVKKISVEFWYKDWVVIVQDENDKKFFLTPGVNIKIETAAAPSPEEPQQPEAPQEPDAPSVPPAGAPQQPTPEPQAQAPQQPTSEPQAQAPQEPAQQAAPETPTEQPVEQPAEQPVVPKKKKKPAPQPVAEEAEGEDEDEIYQTPQRPIDSSAIQRDIGSFLMDELGIRLDVRPYIKKAVYGGDAESWNSIVKLEIPKNVLNIDPREFKLAYKTYSYHSSGPGQSFGRGSVDVEDIGRNWVIRFSDNGGLDI